MNYFGFVCDMHNIYFLSAFLLLRSNPSRQHSKVLYHLGGQEKRKDRKRSEEKVFGFSSASLFPTRKQEAVTQGGTI